MALGSSVSFICELNVSKISLSGGQKWAGWHGELHRVVAHSIF